MLLVIRSRYVRIRFRVGLVVIVGYTVFGAESLPRMTSENTHTAASGPQIKRIIQFRLGAGLRSLSASIRYYY